MTVRVTKKAAESIFRENLSEAKAKGHWTYRASDKVALREAWNNYTDSLCKDGLITERQYETWTNPFNRPLQAPTNRL